MIIVLYVKVMIVSDIVERLAATRIANVSHK